MKIACLNLNLKLHLGKAIDRQRPHFKRVFKCQVATLYCTVFARSTTNFCLQLAFPATIASNNHQFWEKEVS